MLSSAVTYEPQHRIDRGFSTIGNRLLAHCNSMWYENDTPDEVIHAINWLHRHKIRVRIFSGDIVTGRDWLSEFQTTGTIGKSTGSIKIPLMIYNSRSLGGGAIMTNAIVKITAASGGRHVYYQHDKYHYPPMAILPDSTYPDYPHAVWTAPYEGEPEAHIIARFKSLDAARRWLLKCN